MQQFCMYINGHAVKSDKSFTIINPATGKSFAEAQMGSAAHVDQAVAAAKAAFPAWSRTSDEERAVACHALAKAIEDNFPELMNLVTLETGKPLGGLNNIGAGAEVFCSIYWAQSTAALKLPVDVIQDDDDARIEVHRKPLGVVASITPWNWPLLIAIWQIIPALRVGNSVVIKPSPFAPVSITRFVELAQKVLPPGVLNLVNGEGDVGGALTAHPDVSKVSFTGSTGTGKRVMASASASLKRLTLELGGNDAGIVLPDVDVKEVAPKLFHAAFQSSGQYCSAMKRLYVHESQYEEMCEEFAALARNVKVGDGMEEGMELGPVQNAAQFKIVCDLAESARADGGRFIAGGKPMDREGYFFEPTVVADLTDGCRLVDEEPFGPILPIIKYANIDEVIDLANRNDRGLGGSIWSKDLEQAAQYAQRLECGSAYVNDHATLQPNVPFGGVKQSGMGVSFGLYGLEEYASLQTLKVVKK